MQNNPPRNLRFVSKNEGIGMLFCSPIIIAVARYLLLKPVHKSYANIPAKTSNIYFPVWAFVSGNNNDQ
jgi:hypothetical protein